MIGNLVPACGKCNQSKGNKPWRDWMTSSAQRSPATRGIPDLRQRMERLDAFEAWKPQVPLDFQELVDKDLLDGYWSLTPELREELLAYKPELLTLLRS